MRWPRRQRQHLSWGVLVTAALLIFFHYQNGLKIFEDGLRYLFTPVIKSGYALKQKIISARQPFTAGYPLKNIYSQCVNDQQEISILTARLKVAEQEASLLKSALNFKERVDLTMIGAQVIGEHFDSAARTIIIDRGSDSGFQVGAPVLVGSGALAGQIIEVNQNTSKILLLSDNHSKIAATILNRDYSLGVVEGGYGLSIKMSLIPRHEAVLVGDQVVTSGLENNWPRGLLIGVVAALENEPYKPFQQALLTPAVDLNKLTSVVVLTGR